MSPIRGNPFSVDGSWYVGSPHNHSTASDGRCSVRELAEWYQDRGVDFMFFTDHNVVADVSDAESLSILVLPGAEISVCWDQAFGAEILCLGVTQVKRKGVHPQEVIYDVLEQGGLPYISHPYLSGVYSSLMMDLDGLVGIELFNLAGLHLANRGFATVHMDDLMGVGKVVWGLASEDRHSLRGDKPQAWIEVRASACDREGIMDALRHGLYYSTTGPKIHDISVSETHVTVKSSKAKQISFSSMPWLSKRVDAIEGAWLTEARVEVDQLGSTRRLEAVMDELVGKGELTARKRVSPHVRVEVSDGVGGFAWSNPIQLP